MQSIVELQTTTSSLQIMETSADILAQAPDINKLQIGKTTTNDYYFDIYTTKDSVDVVMDTDPTPPKY